LLVDFFLASDTDELHAVNLSTLADLAALSFVLVFPIADFDLPAELGLEHVKELLIVKSLRPLKIQRAFDYDRDIRKFPLE
jgi:hypothetical protein